MAERLDIWRSTSIPILLYGCTCWIPTKELLLDIQTWERKYLRSVLRLWKKLSGETLADHRSRTAHIISDYQKKYGIQSAPDTFLKFHVRAACRVAVDSPLVKNQHIKWFLPCMILKRQDRWTDWLLDCINVPAIDRYVDHGSWYAGLAYVLSFMSRKDIETDFIAYGRGKHNSIFSSPRKRLPDSRKKPEVLHYKITVGDMFRRRWSSQQYGLLITTDSQSLAKLLN